MTGNETSNERAAGMLRMVREAAGAVVAWVTYAGLVWAERVGWLRPIHEDDGRPDGWRS